MRKFLVYAPTIIVLMVLGFFCQSKGAFFGVNLAFGYGGGGDGGGGGGIFYTPAVNAWDVPMVIDGQQEGVLTVREGTDGGAVLNVPKGSFTGTVTFKIVAGSVDGASPTDGSAISGGDYTITATDLSNNAVNTFNNPLTITFKGLTLPPDVTNIGVYYLDTTTNTWILIPGVVIDPAAGTVSFSVSHLTKFAVFNVAGTPSTLKTSITKVATAAPVVTEKTTIDGFTISFRIGLTATQKQRITNLVNSGRLFTETDAKNYAYATGQSNWQQFVGKNPKTTVVASDVIFTRFLTIGSTGTEVRALQQVLKDLGYYTYSTITGYFGSLTKSAVINYQKAKSLSPYPGYVGPGTRAALNAE